MATTPVLCVDKIGSRSGYTVVDSDNPIPFNRSSDYPTGATASNDAALTGAAAALSAVLPAVAGKTVYVSGFEITSTGSTAAAAVRATITGAQGGTIVYIYTTQTNPNQANLNLTVNFSPPIPASGTGVALTLALPSLGSGNTNAAIAIHGYVI